MNIIDTIDHFIAVWNQVSENEVVFAAINRALEEATGAEGDKHDVLYGNKRVNLGAVMSAYEEGDFDYFRDAFRIVDDSGLLDLVQDVDAALFVCSEHAITISRHAQQLLNNAGIWLTYSNTLPEDGDDDDLPMVNYHGALFTL